MRVEVVLAISGGQSRSCFVPMKPYHMICMQRNGLPTARSQQQSIDENSYQRAVFTVCWIVLVRDWHKYVLQ